MTRETCHAEKACRAPVAHHGLCKKHYQRWLRWGDPYYVAQPKRRDPTCTVRGCGKPHHGQGFCHKHAKRAQRHGAPDVVYVRGRRPPGIDYDRRVPNPG